MIDDDVIIIIPIIDNIITDINKIFLFFILNYIIKMPKKNH